LWTAGTLPQEECNDAAAVRLLRLAANVESCCERNRPTPSSILNEIKNGLGQRSKPYHLERGTAEERPTGAVSGLNLPSCAGTAAISGR
jgi:hypothetical protein